VHEPTLALREVERAASCRESRLLHRDPGARQGPLGRGLPACFRRIEASGLPLFLHPVEVIGHQRLATYYLNQPARQSFESGSPRPT